MGVQFSNNAEGTFAAGITDSDTAITLEAGDGALFPAASVSGGTYFYATLIKDTGAREIVKVTEHTGGTDVFTVIIRAQDDTSAIAFSTAEKCELRFPKIILVEFRDDIATNTSDLVDYETSNDIAVAALESKDTADEQVLYAPTGLVMYIYNAAADIPVGWSAHSGPADCLLAIVGGSEAYDVEGGNLVGSWVATNHTHTGPSHVHTGPSHTHTGPNHTHTGPSHVHTMGAHTHRWSWAGRYSYNQNGTTHTFINGGLKQIGLVHQVTSADPYLDPNEDLWTSPVDPGDTNLGGTAATGAGGTGATGADGTSNTGSSGTANTGGARAPSTDRPYSAAGLLIERD
jgi:hypothetical protein